MTIIDKRDQDILGFIAARGEVSFKELEESGMMAKSTLCKHLGELRKTELVEKIISKKSNRGSHVVYVLTARGQKLYYKLYGTPGKLKDYF
jgi:DNA-binding HxlR family transcriptional regulator